MKIYAGVTITFVNDDTGLAGNSVRFTESSAKPVFDKTVAKGDTVAVKFSAVRVMTYTATSGAALNPPTDTGKITVVAKPTPSPTPTTSHSPSPKPQPSTGPSPQPGSTPPPGTSVLGQGLSQVPQFGSGTLFPSPGASSAPLGPVIATDPSASPTPAPSTDQAATSLSQPVDARRLGLPGALAAVLVAGVVVGVVRLARAEFGDGTNHGGGAPPAPPVH